MFSISDLSKLPFLSLKLLNFSLIFVDRERKCDIIFIEGEQRERCVIIMVGARIAEIRNSKGISLSKLSRESGVSKGYLSELENGIKENPNIEILDKIAKALDISVSDLFEQDPIDTELEDLEEDMKLLFSKAKQLSKENRKKVLRMIEIFEEENNN